MEEGEPAVATDKLMLVADLGDDVNRAANQADRCHLRLVPDAVAVVAIVIEQFFRRIPVKSFQYCLPVLDRS